MTTVSFAGPLTRARPRRAFAALAVLDLRLIARGAIALVAIVAGLTAVVVLQ